MHASVLDGAVFQAQAALEAKGVAAPTALFLSATGLGLLPARLASGKRIPLANLPGVPTCWQHAILHWGDFNGLSVWMLEDEPADLETTAPVWAEAFPVWLAAAAGASALVHTSAGHGLGGTGAAVLGSLALLSDHVNLSGTSVLVALGESRLGPIFPDQTQVHDVHLRRAAKSVAAKLGIVATECVAACTLGPSIDTPAERRWFAQCGAAVAVQRLASPILAAAHAGLGSLCVVVVTDSGDGPLDIARVAATSGKIAPALDDFLWTLAADVQQEARARLEQET
jgi:purine-nucleoside phosphorylase